MVDSIGPGPVKIQKIDNISTEEAIDEVAGRSACQNAGCGDTEPVLGQFFSIPDQKDEHGGGNSHQKRELSGQDSPCGSLVKDERKVEKTGDDGDGAVIAWGKVFEGKQFCDLIREQNGDGEEECFQRKRKRKIVGTKIEGTGIGVQ